MTRCANTAALREHEQREADLDQAATIAAERTEGNRAEHIRALKADQTKLIEAVTNYLEEAANLSDVASTLFTVATKGCDGELVVGKGSARNAAQGLLEEACGYDASMNLHEVTADEVLAELGGL